MRRYFVFTFCMVMIIFDSRVVRDNSISHRVIDTDRHLPPLFLFFISHSTESYVEISSVPVVQV